MYIGDVGATCMRRRCGGWCLASGTVRDVPTLGVAGSIGRAGIAEGELVVAMGVVNENDKLWGRA